MVVGWGLKGKIAEIVYNSLQSFGSMFGQNHTVMTNKWIAEEWEQIGKVACIVSANTEIAIWTIWMKKSHYLNSIPFTIWYVTFQLTIYLYI